MRKLLVLRDPQMLARELNAKTGAKPVAAPLSIPATSFVAEARLHTVPPPAPPVAVPPSTILEQVSKAKQQAESDAILAALNSTRWNRKRAAMLLDIDYKALLYKMKKLGIDDAPAPFAPVFEVPEHAMTAAGD